MSVEADPRITDNSTRCAGRRPGGRRDRTRRRLPPSCRPPKRPRDPAAAGRPSTYADDGAGITSSRSREPKKFQQSMRALVDKHSPAAAPAATPEPPKEEKPHETNVITTHAPVREEAGTHAETGRGGGEPEAGTPADEKEVAPSEPAGKSVVAAPAPIDVDVKFPLSDEAHKSLMASANDPAVSQISRNAGIKRIRIDEPHTFDFSRGRRYRRRRRSPEPERPGPPQYPAP